MEFKIKLNHEILKSMSSHVEKRAGFISSATSKVKKPFLSRLKESGKGFTTSMLMAGAAGTALLGYGSYKYPTIPTR
jgi:hypothetical protein